MQKAIEVEVERQIEAWEDGLYDDEIFQETRLFDQVKQETRSMRGKEEAADYRYFPEPDLLKAVVTDEMFDEFSKIPELPDEKRERLVREYGMREYDAAVITADLEMAHFFESMLEEGISAKNAVTWLTVELQGRLKGGVSLMTSPVDAKKLATVVKRIEDRTISGKAAKEVLDHLMENEDEVDAAIEKLGLKQVSDTGAIEKMVSANPQVVNEIVKNRLG
ncbi:MAG: hypothetical protein B5M52_07475 [Helicobacteraceae bacterium 4484_230]|nr:MAG: hypothetical protein B5M52_07475 [Helicobacteraceae bacterium 4484_230]